MHHLRSPFSAQVLRAIFIIALAAITPFITCCNSPKVGKELTRTGNEIVIAGRMFNIGTPVVLWSDPGGYDAYRTEKRFAPWATSQWTPVGTKGGPDTPSRYGVRFASTMLLAADTKPGEAPKNPAWSDDAFESIRGGGWTLDEAQSRIDQFVIHYDAAGTSRQCFRVLHDVRGLSVHFMLDLDGTIYQTLDVKERAWHATTSNDRSVGIEIANIGAYAAEDAATLNRWYQPPTPDQPGALITIPSSMGDGGLRTPGPFYSRSSQPIEGEIQGRTLRQYDLTPQQYAALIKLTAGLCTVLPRIECDYPRDADGNLLRAKLPDDQLAQYRGLLGHYHLQTNKTDPGPAFDWDAVITGARKQMPRR